MKYNRLEFLKFAQSRAVKHVGVSKSGDYLAQKFVTAQQVNSVLGKLTGINYALMGGFALGFHGYQRATTDIDILVNGGDIERIVGLLGLGNLRPLTIGGTAGTLPDGTEVDLVAPSWAWVGEALRKVHSAPGGKVLSKPFMVLAKLWAARGAGDDMDVLQMIKRMNPQEKKETLEVVGRYMPNDAEDLEQMMGYADLV